MMGDAGHVMQQAQLTTIVSAACLLPGTAHAVSGIGSAGSFPAITGPSRPAGHIDPVCQAFC